MLSLRSYHGLWAATNLMVQLLAIASAGRLARIGASLWSRAGAAALILLVSLAPIIVQTIV
jgi:hypothetical protein